MDDFIRSHIKALQRKSGGPAPKPAHCLRVKEVAARCVAAQAGVAAEDLLVSVDGMPAARQSPRLYLTRSSKRAYAFHSPSRGERTELATTGIEIGVLLDYTLEAIKARYDPRTSSPEALEALWDAGDWADLEALSARTIEATGRAQPALVFLGAALYETGRREEGLSLVGEYAREHARSWTMNFAAVALYYSALEQLAGGASRPAAEALRRAWETSELSRIASALERSSGQRPSRVPRWRGEPFPVDYDLSTLGGQGGRAGLGPALASMAPNQILLVCLLANYRGNGPYDDFMARYLNFATYLTPFLHGLHVITMAPDRPRDRPHYFRNEDAVRAAGRPLEILLDEGALTETMAPPGSPFVLAVQKSGRVVAEGEISCVDFWNAVSAAQPS